MAELWKTRGSTNIISNTTYNNNLNPDTTMRTASASPTPVHRHHYHNHNHTHAHSHTHLHPDDDPSDFTLSTLRDPRKSHSTSPNLSRSASPAPQRHPDLSNEVAALSDKLIQAINNQTFLDDSLQEARQELDHYRHRVLELELLTKQHERDVAEGNLLRKEDTDEEMGELRSIIEKERIQRSIIEKEKKDIESELETLTAALFEEANRMVIDAKKEREVVEKKNEQLRAQVNDTEILLASHQEQLAQLKS
ncbi:rab guanine nucleotide exchange factor S2, partial [Ascosphaera aggregata]